MLGYNDLKDPSVSGFFRFLSKVGDNMMKMQIVKMCIRDRDYIEAVWGIGFRLRAET